MGKGYSNIILDSRFTESLRYNVSGKAVKTKYPEREDWKEHGLSVKARLESCFEADDTERKIYGREYRKGIYLDFSGLKGFSLPVEKFNSEKKGISLLNVHKDAEETTATVYVPNTGRGYFLKKIDEYLTRTVKSGNRKNNDLVRSIETIRTSVVESFWVGDACDIPGDKKEDYEIWLRTGLRKTGAYHITPEEKEFVRICGAAHIYASDTAVRFPERVVRLVHADRSDIERLLRTCECVAEIRRAFFPNSFIVRDSESQQRVYGRELLKRTSFDNPGNVSVCLLDSGVNANHPLLSPALECESLQSVNKQWGTGDYGQFRGHGTGMAGIALYGDLMKCLDGGMKTEIRHGLESVKILPPGGSNDRKLFGEITKQAVAVMEIVKPECFRVNCMAVTTQNRNTGTPSSWSAAVDSVASGSEDAHKRLFLLSAGNVSPTETREQGYIDACTNHRVEDPGQSWNAITVGAYTDSVIIADDYFDGFEPVARKGELSPSSSTSVLWNNAWPIKPEIVFEGGNFITNGIDVDTCEDTSVLTTSTDLSRFFTTASGTSPATAKAAWFCAQLMDMYPKLWPETIRALTVHSAEWTETMLEEFEISSESTKADYRRILRSCGYGVPDLKRAGECMDNSVNMVIQAEMQPYMKKGSVITFNEMHFHTLPWPKDELERLAERSVSLKITLSYFVEPSPTEGGWNNRTRYQSCGLRFAVRKPGESPEEFRRNITKISASDEGHESSKGKGSQVPWKIGPSNRDKGSIHSDTYEVAAIDLSESNVIAVFPVGGWWKTRKKLEKYNKTIRYSLVVTLSTPETECDLYTPIVTQIENRTVIETTV